MLGAGELSTVLILHCSKVILRERLDATCLTSRATNCGRAARAFLVDIGRSSS